MEGRESKVVENVKKAMFIKGGRTNESVSKALKELVPKNEADCVRPIYLHLFKQFIFIFNKVHFKKTFLPHACQVSAQN